jgi:hypothetical protein
MAPDPAMPSALLLDLQGVLVEDQRALPGAVDTVNLARRRGVAIRFVTNTATRHHDDLLQDLQQLGFATEPCELPPLPWRPEAGWSGNTDAPWPWCIRRSRHCLPAAVVSRRIAFFWGTVVIG